ncbi:hypothetical protein GCM10010329_54740 [Streptomyces spiroverticillatus]|uniref:Uncharacterized protein n=1 Tax=Streptomyces finlayi TaxID=67296 RepID=A0A919CCL4_9ACTN|nr:hypothetical protein [Streptomyces finlayi]GHA24446.1 hypothetical protein GCM10010329_54740 [Streptomyces spiroverticillatus]GHD05870.1 hypothetical protein GCM10010334_57060 [Streptomyces finlayi]
MNARGGETFEAGRARAEIDALLAGAVPASGPTNVERQKYTGNWLSSRGAGFVIAELWAGEDLSGVYGREWDAAEEQASGHLDVLTEELDARWGTHEEVGMTAAVFRATSGDPVPPLYTELRNLDAFGDLRVWGPVRVPDGDSDRWVGISVNQIDGDTPHFLIAVVTDRPIREPEEGEEAGPPAASRTVPEAPRSRRVVRAFWGPRPETPEGLAARWAPTLRRVAELVPEAGDRAADPWTWHRITANGPATPVAADQESLVRALRDDGDGSLSLVIEGEEGWSLDISGHAGHASAYLSQSVVLTVRAPHSASVREAELLACVAELWDPDIGNVLDDDVFDLLEERADLQPGDDNAGWLTYLSPGRAALVPDDLKAVRTTLATGGVLLDLAAPSDHEAVLAAHVRLRDSAALQPLPTPMDRSKL